MLLAKEIPHYTYDDYDHWEGRWELIGGHPIAMSPLPRPKHQKITAKLLSAFIVALEKSNCQNCEVYGPIDYKITEDTIIQPDILIVCEEITKNYLDFAPHHWSSKYYPLLVPFVIGTLNMKYINNKE